MLQTYSTDDAEELEMAMVFSQSVDGAAVVGAGVTATVFFFKINFKTV